MTEIAELKLEFEAAKDKLTKVTISLSAPEYSKAKGAWGCEIMFKGFFEKPQKIFGEDSFQALCLSLEFINRTLRHVMETTKIYMGGSKCTDPPLLWPADAYFPETPRQEKKQD